MKTAIITLYGFFNYGNRLQNYALQEALGKCGCDAVSLAVDSAKEKVKGTIKRYIEKREGRLCPVPLIERVRENNFRRFSRRYIRTKRYTRASRSFAPALENEFDCFVVGSDQVWNPLFWEKEGFERSADNYLLRFVGSKRKVAYAASFGVSEIESSHRPYFAEALPGFRRVTVREEAGAAIVRDLSGVEAETVLDPTMLLERHEWRKLEKGYYSDRGRFVVVYFLGEQPDGVREGIAEYAKSIDAQIIDIMDPSDRQIYRRGPESFVELIDRAEACFTDSFHAAAFSIIFHTPFAACERKHSNRSDMNSRIHNLLKTLSLEDRMCTGDIRAVSMEYDFSAAELLLEKHRLRSLGILKEAISGQ